MGYQMRLFCRILFGLSALSLLCLYGCGENTEQDKPSEDEIVQPKMTKVTSVEGIINNQKLTIGDTINIKILAENDISIDSVRLTFNGNQQIALGNELVVYTFDLLPGKQTITVEATSANGIEKHSFIIEMLSDIVPEEFTYQRVTYYTHDPDAYTQGLFYHDGFLYENTGRKGQSSLRKVELTTGIVLEQSFLSDKYFGEGITLWKDQIIQLTWTANQGFVYALDGFEQLKSFNYSSEGWGITTLEDKLVMSDGEENLHFLDPETLQETHQLKVYDDNGPVKNLNELEYIEGAIYANVYETDEIVTIDPETGKVLTRIDLTDLMNAQWNRPINVLNGIAYDKSSKRLFVTGKLWPRLYEIRLIEKKPS